MRHPKLDPVVYEYRYCNVSDGIRNEITRNRFSLFNRKSREIEHAEKSNNWDLLIAKLGIICGIALIGYILSMIF